jgi:hypothetical protein
VSFGMMATALTPSAASAAASVTTSAITAFT